MNFDRDFREFSGLLDDIWALKGQALQPGAKMVFFRALEGVSIVEVRAGLNAHLLDPKRGQFLPMPADVISQIRAAVADDGRPGAEEAWAQASRASDERATIVWTAEMAEAYGVCRPLVLEGDRIGARMAFREAYERLVTAARERREPVSWSASLGEEASDRRAALLPHVEAGRISRDLLLEAPATSLSDVLRLEGPKPDTEAAKAGRALALAAAAKLREEMAERAARVSSDAAAKVETGQAKAAAGAAVGAYVAAGAADGARGAA